MHIVSSGARDVEPATKLTSSRDVFPWHSRGVGQIRRLSGAESENKSYLNKPMYHIDIVTLIYDLPAYDARL